MPLNSGQKSNKTDAGTAPTITPTRTVAHTTIMALGAPLTLLPAETRLHNPEVAAAAANRKL